MKANKNRFSTFFYRKAVKAAIVLQPLLGITNSIQMLAAPDSQNIIYFALWSVVTTFLSSFQGFFAALFYCFLNGEVRRKNHIIWLIRLFVLIVTFRLIVLGAMCIKQILPNNANSTGHPLKCRNVLQKTSIVAS